MNIFRFRLFYIWLILTTICITILYATAYCKPTIKLEPVTNVHVLTFFGTDTDTFTATTKDGTEIIAASNSASNSDIKKTHKMYVFRGKSNQAYNISLKKAFIKKDMQSDQVGWTIVIIVYVIMTSIGSYLIDMCLPGKRIIFHKKEIKINI